tara:strand:+ start:2990 stop:4258 length:1269 start_codon:yes stop_codon:yes gene_type:complete
MLDLFSLFYKTTGVCTDTRHILKDSLFIALKGENFNGNLFATKAIEKGAKFAIVDEKKYADNLHVFYVEDSLKFLQNLAKQHRDNLNIPIIGITGSNGKTSTKELMHCVLSKKYNTLATTGNLNNHIGVPLTLLRLTHEHEIGIIEMGANKPGDIKELCSITSPTHGIITNVGKAHLEGFGNIDGVLKTKTELYDSVARVKGAVFYNEDDLLIKNQLNSATQNISYGQEKADVVGQLHYLDPFIKMSWKNNSYNSPRLTTKMIGNYNFYNFLAAICIGAYFKVEEDLISEAIVDYTPENKRSQVLRTDRNLLIVDCYNANPTSMKLALESFIHYKHPQKIVILGDMLELGIESILEHQKILRICLDNKLNYMTVGPIFKSINNKNSYENVIQIKGEMSGVTEFAVLLKGSRGIKLEELIESL